MTTTRHDDDVVPVWCRNEIVPSIVDPEYAISSHAVSRIPSPPTTILPAE